MNACKYAWDEADWETHTNAEIARDLGMTSSPKAASVRVSQMRRRLAPHTIGRFTGAAGYLGLHHSAKLTPKDVRAVRRLAAGGLSHKRIGQRYGVDASTISRIVNGRTRKRVP